jgi:sodium-dependent multivitamin transporter 6
MLFALTSFDYAVLAGYLVVMIGIGAYFSRAQHSSCDFFLASRSMGWFPIGISIMATLLSALSYSGIPGEAYYEGYHFLVMPLAVWCALPIMSWVVLPIYHRLQIYSIYEYLELRFDARTRFVSSLFFVVWRLLWLGGVLYAPCKVLLVAAGLQIPTWWLLVVLGLVSTLYTFLGGMKAVIWTDVIQAAVMAGGLVLVVGAVWYQVDGGAARVAEVTSGLGRGQIIDPVFDMSAKWSIWGIAPHFFLAMLSFYVADQITVQRYLTARNLSEARRSFALNCLSVTLMVPALMYAGLCLLTFYHDHPQAMRPIWAANVDHLSNTSITGSDGRPLIPWQADAITVDNVDRLVAEHRLIRPNSEQPFADSAQLLRRDGAQVHVDVERLAMRRPPGEQLKQGEIIINQSAKDELFPHFITSQLWRGVAGLILAALLAASMSSMDSGLNSICTLMIVDYHRRLGWGRRWLAKRLGKPADTLDESDELRIARPLVLIVGVAATLFSILIAQINDIFAIMIGVVNTFGAPLLAIFLLGMFTRRTTATAALFTLLSGTLFTVWLMVANTYDAMSWLWPWEASLHGIWSLSLGVIFSLVVGYLASFVCGRPKSREQLRGLVVGNGELGVRGPEEASLAIPEDFGETIDDPS